MKNDMRILKFIKSIFVFAFVVYFLGISTGVNFSIHYCGGKLVDVTFFGQNQLLKTNKDKCELLNLDTHNSVINANNDCCLDKYLHLHLESSSVVPIFKSQITPLFSTINYNELSNFVEKENCISNYYIDTSPPNTSPPLFILYKQLLTYS